MTKLISAIYTYSNTHIVLSYLSSILCKYGSIKGEATEIGKATRMEVKQALQNV